MTRSAWFCSFGNFSPAFGAGSDEGSEALPDNWVYLTWVGALTASRCL